MTTILALTTFLLGFTLGIILMDRYKVEPLKKALAESIDLGMRVMLEKLALTIKNNELQKDQLVKSPIQML